MLSTNLHLDPLLPIYFPERWFAFFPQKVVQIYFYYLSFSHEENYNNTIKCIWIRHFQLMNCSFVSTNTQNPNAFHHKLQKKKKTDMLNMLMRLLGSLSWAAEIRIDWLVKFRPDFIRMTAIHFALVQFLVGGTPKTAKLCKTCWIYRLLSVSAFVFVWSAHTCACRAHANW